MTNVQIMTDHQVEPHLFVVFGATSDLMRRKLLPALYRFSEQYGPQKLSSWWASRGSTA